MNVYSGEIIAGTDIAIAGGRIAYVGPDAGHTIGPNTEVIEAAGRYLVPGLCDGHMHVESGMLTVTEFARAVIPHGTTSMFIDPHEIANVLGLAGVRLMHDEAAGLPVNIRVQVPSCMPAAPGLENAGGVINGFVSGFGYDSACAVASTFAHDSHHMTVIGTSKGDMAKAANRLAEIRGGITVFKDGQEIATVELPIASLMSDKRAKLIAKEAEEMVAAIQACGCKLNNAFMQHSLLGLVVIPELRISDLGLIDVTRFETVSVFL